YNHHKNIYQLNYAVLYRPAVCAQFSKWNNAPSIYNQDSNKIADIQLKLMLGGVFTYFYKACNIICKWQRKKQKQNRQHEYHPKAVIINLLFVTTGLIKIPEKCCFHAKCQYGIKYRSIAKHGTENTIY
ncbi:MAG: hypothetical protein JWP45_120, partial [Mucilaginibacter sp.]|nr:hypothetical protein [Mucilaginibacter sp.]